MRSGPSQIQRDDFVFDDDSLEALLYGDAVPEPTPAALFVKERTLLERIGAALCDRMLFDAVRLMARLAEAEFELSESAAKDLLGYLRSLIPDVPCPVLTVDLRPLLPLLGRIETLLTTAGNEVSLYALRNIAYRCYEHTGEYAEARRVLQHLVDSARKENAPSALARYLNNLGFEFLLEERYREAAPHFRLAAWIAAKSHDEREEATMRCNYWTAQMDAIGVRACLRAEPEIQRHRDLFRTTGDWRQRKALILLARFEEARDKPARATSLVREAMAAAKNSYTRWPQIDYAYLQKLKRLRGPQLEFDD